MQRPLADIIDAYNPEMPLAQASTIPASWYIDPRVMDLERRTVFASSWQLRRARRSGAARRRLRFLRAPRRRACRRRSRRRRGPAWIFQRLPPPCGRRGDRAARVGSHASLPVPRVDLRARRRAQRHARFRRRVRLRSRRERPRAARGRRLGEVGVRQGQPRRALRSRHFSAPA